MIQVTYGTNLHRETAIVDPNVSVRSFLEEHGIDYATGMTTLDGATLKPGDYDKSFGELGITTKCFLLNVAKVENA